MQWSGIGCGWPSAAVALVAYGAAFLTPQVWLGCVGAAVATPFCIWATGYPLFHSSGWIVIPANLLSASLLLRGRRDIAFAALVPFMVIIIALAVLALRGMVLVRG